MIHQADDSGDHREVEAWAMLICGAGWHVSESGSKRCHCGQLTNPSYRSWWQRRKDRWNRKRRNR